MSGSSVMMVGHHERPEVATLARRAADWLRAAGHDPWMYRPDAVALALHDLVADRPPAGADLVISLGGDGTMLRAVQLIDGAPTPILGVNAGLLGYLSEVEPAGMISALENYFGSPADSGEWRLESRMMVEVAVGRRGAEGPVTERWRALNEGVVEKDESGHTVRLLVRIDGAPFTSYAADGLIVATPTGSTAYSLSARGPVVSPRHRALLLTPVSPHMLFDRSLVLDPEEQVEVEVAGHRPVALAIDGQRVTSLSEGDVVSFTASPCSALLVRFGRRRFHQILKAKFGLADR